MHHIQKSILLRLAFADSLRFSELKPGELENKLFDYHLKQVIRDGLVGKDEAGRYNLTPEGRQSGVREVIYDSNGTAQAHSISFLVIRRKSDDAWLLYKRLAHPLKDLVGFMHATPRPTMTVTESASKEVLRKIGLKASFYQLGSGFFRMMKGDQLESFTHFELLVADDCSGGLSNNHELAEYFWVTNPDFGAPNMLPNMSVLAGKCLAGKPFFIDETIQLE